MYFAFPLLGFAAASTAVYTVRCRLQQAAQPTDAQRKQMQAALDSIIQQLQPIVSESSLQSQHPKSSSGFRQHHATQDDPTHKGMQALVDALGHGDWSVLTSGQLVELISKSDKLQGWQVPLPPHESTSGLPVLGPILTFARSAIGSIRKALFPTSPIVGQLVLTTSSSLAVLFIATLVMRHQAQQLNKLLSDLHQPKLHLQVDQLIRESTSLVHETHACARQLNQFQDINHLLALLDSVRRLPQRLVHMHGRMASTIGSIHAHKRDLNQHNAQMQRTAAWAVGASMFVATAGASGLLNVVFGAGISAKRAAVAAAVVGAVGGAVAGEWQDERVARALAELKRIEGECVVGNEKVRMAAGELVAGARKVLGWLDDGKASCAQVALGCVPGTWEW